MDDSDEDERDKVVVITDAYDVGCPSIVDNCGTLSLTTIDDRDGTKNEVEFVASRFNEPLFAPSEATLPMLFGSENKRPY